MNANKLNILQYKMAASLITPLTSGNSGSYGSTYGHQASEESNGSDIRIEIHEEDEYVNFTIYSKEFRVIRWTLRGLSLWHPRSTCLFENFIYPAFVNVLLTIMIAVDILILIRDKWAPYVFLAIHLATYQSHLFGVLYFRSRDLEENILQIELKAEQAKQLRRSLRMLTRWSLITFIILVILVLMFFNTEIWLKRRFKCNSIFPFLHVFFSYIYGVGASLSISWIICLLQEAALVRLEQLEQRYYIWTGTAEDAMYEYITIYSKKIRQSCNALSKWFIAHNLILVVATLFLIYDILQAVKNIQQTSISMALLVAYLIYAFVIWVVPLLFAERLQIHEENFISSINKLCPGIIMQVTQNVHHTAQQNSFDQDFTFQSRSEVNKLLLYLKSRKSGFLVGNYSFQFKLSMFSLVLGLIAFASRIVGV